VVQEKLIKKRQLEEIQWKKQKEKGQRFKKGPAGLATVMSKKQ